MEAVRSMSGLHDVQKSSEMLSVKAMTSRETILAAIQRQPVDHVDIIWRNGFHETADFYSPAMLEQFLGDRLRREADIAHASGMMTNYTVHTGIMPILDHFAGLHFDALFGIDIAFHDADMERIRDKLAPTKCLWNWCSKASESPK